MKLKNKNSNGDKTQKLKLLQNWKTQIVTSQKLKLWRNSNCDKTQIVAKLKMWRRKKTQKLKMWQNSNCDKTEELKVWQENIKLKSDMKFIIK